LIVLSKIILFLNSMWVIGSTSSTWEHVSSFLNSLSHSFIHSFISSLFWERNLQICWWCWTCRYQSCCFSIQWLQTGSFLLLSFLSWIFRMNNFIDTTPNHWSDYSFHLNFLYCNHFQ
jgi:hypothetical protein